MLVLSRSESQKVDVADGEIVVTVLEIRGKLVRLGFEAPGSVSINRREVTERLVQESASPRRESTTA